MLPFAYSQPVAEATFDETSVLPGSAALATLQSKDTKQSSHSPKVDFNKIREQIDEAESQEKEWERRFAEA